MGQKPTSGCVARQVCFTAGSRRNFDKPKGSYGPEPEMKPNLKEKP